MCRRQSGGIEVERSPVRVQPGMKFHAPVMCRFDHIFHRIVGRIYRRHTLLAGQKLAPGHIGRFIHGIASGADLHKNSIHVHGFQHIEEAIKFHFLPVNGQARL